MSVDFMIQRGEGLDAEIIGESINVSNTNAAELLRLLGYRPDAEPTGSFELAGAAFPTYGELCGEDTADGFHARVLTARAMLGTSDTDGQGTPDVVDSGEGRATVVYCGRRPGYLAGRLGELEDLAWNARILQGARVVWA